MGFLWPMAACAITGLALYVSRGVLDQTVTSNGIVRFAMLPPWQALVGFICLGALLLVGIDHLNAPRATTTATRRPRLGELVLPLFSSIVLLVPYMPILPDRWPVLQALAGPLGAIVWLVVAALQVWALWQSRRLTARTIERWSLTTISIALFVAAMAVAGLAASKLTGTSLFPSGDEPHYLVMAQSLWRDGDLKIENNHERGLSRVLHVRSRAALPDARQEWRDLFDPSDRPFSDPRADLCARRLRRLGVVSDRARRAGGGDRVALDGGHAQRAGSGDVRVGGDRAVGAVHVQHLHGVSGDRRGARGDDRVRDHNADER